MSLPTEAQWEYACRAGTTTAYYFGDDWRQLEHYGWYSGHKNPDEWRNSEEGSRQILSKWDATPHVVGTKKANAWGLFDMHGNVREWCSDWDDNYPSGAVIDPVGPSSGRYRVFRGGSWSDSAKDCRAAYRNSCVPSGQYHDFGLRLALVFSESE